MCLLWAILAYYSFLYLSLDLPRLNVNRAIGDPVDRTFAAPVFGKEFHFDMDQISAIEIMRELFCCLELMTSRLQQEVVRGRHSDAE
jgi:hypothetical protein